MQVQANADKWKHCWLFEVGNMRNGHLKTVRKLWKEWAPYPLNDSQAIRHRYSSGRMIFGRGAVMAKGLGNTVEEEHLPGLHLLFRVCLHPRLWLMLTLTIMGSISKAKLAFFYRLPSR